MVRRFLFACLLFVALPAHAGSCVVDFQTAVTETEEGKAAQKRIDAMLESRRNEVTKMQADFEQEVKDLQSRAMILSDDARAEAEQALMAKQARLQGLIVGNRRGQQEYIAALEQTGIRPVIDRSFPLEQLADAFRFQETGGHFGKIVIEW